MPKRHIKVKDSLQHYPEFLTASLSDVADYGSVRLKAKDDYCLFIIF